MFYIYNNKRLVLSAASQTGALYIDVCLFVFLLFVWCHILPAKPKNKAIELIRLPL